MKIIHAIYTGDDRDGYPVLHPNCEVLWDLEDLSGHEFTSSTSAVITCEECVRELKDDPSFCQQCRTWRCKHKEDSA